MDNISPLMHFGAGMFIKDTTSDGSLDDRVKSLYLRSKQRFGDINRKWHLMTDVCEGRSEIHRSYPDMCRKFIYTANNLSPLGFQQYSMHHHGLQPIEGGIWLLSNTPLAWLNPHRGLQTGEEVRQLPVPLNPELRKKPTADNPPLKATLQRELGQFQSRASLVQEPFEGKY